MGNFTASLKRFAKPQDVIREPMEEHMEEGMPDLRPELTFTPVFNKTPSKQASKYLLNFQTTKENCH
ncbi:hypothetical protein G9A89_015262 [Geosiphon pyriformis]|nr:hypothetical protein G9A89_015262 [Geosiphon pyriformis]